MSDFLLIFLTVVYLLIVAILFVYGLNFYYLTYLAWRKPSAKEAPLLEELPMVTVQLPVYNEMYVTERLIEAVARLDYPRNLLEIQVLDDSTDVTTDLVKRTVEKVRQRGINIVHIHRINREGYKAGALAEGIVKAKGEFLAVFDADFIPNPDFLLKTIPHFGDPKVAFVQTRWGHVNRNYSFITLVQSIAIDGHFAVEQFARSLGGYVFNFNGTAGLWRKAAIDDAGGWKADTLTEDLDLSYRVYLHGWHGKYLRDVEVQAELPASFVAYRRQQHRWARGSLECAMKLLPQVWSSKILTPAQKIEATLHLTGYGVHLLLFVLTFLYPIVILMTQRDPALANMYGFGFIFSFTSVAPTIFFLFAQRELKRDWVRMIPVILFLAAMGSGMMINTLRAFIQIFTHTNNTFERTPKFGISQEQQDWTQHKYQLQFDGIVFPELAFALWNGMTIVMAIQAQNWGIALWALLFFVGLVFVSGVSIAQSIAVYRSSLVTAKAS
jgi:cellulose synthase/poly-beta-1,6-N-acetylglucosamine synthase-like glycosyltransferase